MSERPRLHDRHPEAMGFAVRDIESGAAAFMPTIWLVVRPADGGSSAISRPAALVRHLAAAPVIR